MNVEDLTKDLIQVYMVLMMMAIQEFLMEGNFLLTGIHGKSSFLHGVAIIRDVVES